MSACHHRLIRINNNWDLSLCNNLIVCEDFKEMNTDVGSEFSSRTISDILTEVSGILDFSKKSTKVDFHVQQLEEEMKKIEAFKRELPFCMHLLKDAIERLKEENQRGRGVEEFIPLKKDGGGEGRAKSSNDITEKKDWMSCVQLWSTPIHYETTTNQDSVFHLKSGYEEGCNFRNRVGAFAAFKKPSTVEKEGTAGGGGLSLSIPASTELESIENSDSKFSRLKLQQPNQQEQQRKQRRCWSPELHKRFVDALYQLGGPQSATPKQIRELMRVDGLTNDEVKSHLQKYRIHIKRVQTPSKPAVGHSGSPQGPLNQGIRAAKGVSAATGGESTVEEDEEEDDRSGSHGRQRSRNIQEPEFC